MNHIFNDICPGITYTNRANRQGTQRGPGNADFAAFLTIITGSHHRQHKEPVFSQRFTSR